MSASAIHLCIVSGQSLPNLLPLCRYRPQQIVLAVSADMAHNVPSLIEALVRLGLVERPEEVLTLPAMPDNDYQRILDWARQQLDQLQQRWPGRALVFNATGGTKLMSQAITSVCQQSPDNAVLYCDTHHDTIEWISPQPRRDPLPAALLDSISILKANGIERSQSLCDDPHWCQSARQRRALTFRLARGAATSLRGPLANLNARLQALKPRAPLVRADATPPPASRQWRRVLNELGITHPPASLHLETDEALRYLRGGWLEEYLWLCMEEAGLSDLHCGLQIHSTHTDCPNELDLAVGHRNRLLVVECKTGKLAKDSFNRMLDKLANLGLRSGGLLAQRWLALSQWPHDSSARQKRLRLLARERQITLIEPSHLAELPQRLQHWKSSLTLPLP